MMSEYVNTSCKYTNLKNDPEAQLELIDKYIKVELIKNCSYCGFLHSIDPITHSVILSVPQGDVFETNLIPGHAIMNITEVPYGENIKPIRRQEVKIESSEDLLAKKLKLMAWIKYNLIPVQEMDNKIVLGNVSLLSPYNVSDICTDNPIIASQIKQLIDKMPEDFTP